ncbi:uncharacterized protein LOC111078014 [Drosophila obscura]|uniref:uncharacterized protein LOC111078014 n=1 Tax=Drosophila obscura TaxID=7282 RepID=UPI001BB1E168|nr:uncharacterized protein LOC111078014 [Drosophila obscura]
MSPRRSARILAKNAASNQEAASAAVQPAASRRIMSRRGTTNTTASRQRTGLRRRAASRASTATRTAIRLTVLSRNAYRRAANITANERAATYRRDSDRPAAIVWNRPHAARRRIANQPSAEGQTVVYRSTGDAFPDLFPMISDLENVFHFGYEILPLEAVGAPENANRVAAAQANPMRTNIGFRRLHSELAKMKSEPTDGCEVELLGDSIYNWRAVILGPSGTPYEGGHFELHIRFPTLYPSQPPSLQFRTKIYHCNIHHGFVCMDILGSNWSPALTVEKLLLSIRSLLADPNPDSPMNCVVADMYKKNRQQHDLLAREWTARYAKAGASPSAQSYT